MPRESKASKRERAIEVCRRMEERYPGAAASLDFVNPFQLLIAVLLSAQTTDANVNRVTPELFRRWPGPAELAAAPQSEVEEVIHPCGYYHTKAAHAIASAQRIVSDFGGEVPRTMEELCSLPGVGRKTANIVLNEGYGIVEGIAVDTHVYRLATRLGFTRASSPAEAEQDLLKLLPRELWKPVNSQWILFGREVCDARSPKCGECMLADICPSAGKGGNPTSKSKARSKKAKAKPRSRSQGR
jgi:endonuclease-3